MKKIYKFLVISNLLALSAFISQAQITITSSDMPSSSSMYNVSMGQAFTGMDETQTGLNYSWDYSQLTYTSQTVDTFVTVLSTGLYALSFSNASYALKSNTPPVTLSGITIDYQYDFFKKVTSSYVLMGFGASFSGIPLGVPNNPKDTLYRFPLHSGDVGSCASAFSASIPTIAFYGGNKLRTDTVDGWGTLTTPYGSFSALRVKSVIDETDSIYLDAASFGFSFPRPQSIEYKWLGTGQGIPLLQINTTAGIVTQIIYKDSIRTTPLSVSSLQKEKTDFIIYPNPSTDKAFIELNIEKPADVSVDVFNLTGEKVFSKSFGKRNSGNQVLVLDLSGAKIPAGNYFVEMNLNGERIKKMLTLTK